MTLLATLSVLWMARMAAAAELPPDGAPSPSNVRGEAYPWVHADGRVSFRMDWPAAKTVAVRGRGALWDKQTLALKKDADGRWIGTVPAYAPGFYYYEVLVDGHAVTNPHSETYFGWAQETSGLEIPDPKADFYLEKDVPHGEVRMRPYQARTTKSLRVAHVYTPPDYDRSRRRYPVLYLQHGSGENVTGWTRQGRANLILDNLIAAGKAQPMIVVMETGYARDPDQAATDADGKARSDNADFEALVVGDLIPMIDRTYRTLTGPRDRAIAGLSMGGGQATRIALGNPKVFGSVGSLSGGAGTLASAQFLADVAGVNKRMRLVWIGCGASDRGFDRAKEAHDKLEAAGIKHTWFTMPGDHEWQVWRHSLHDLAAKLFR